MSADALLQYLTWALYVAVFFAVAARAARLPTRAHLDMTLFFGAVATIVLLSAVVGAFQVVLPRALSAVNATVLLALPYLLLRLVADFALVPTRLTVAVAAGLGVSALAIAIVPPPLPGPVALLLVGYFVVVIVYDTWAFVREARRTPGVTRRRMQAAALGTGCLGLVLLLAGAAVAVPAARDGLGLLTRLAGLASAPAYFVAFAPPTWLRRAWQEPGLRAFLARAARLPRLPDAAAVMRDLEEGAAAAVGVPSVGIGLWSAAAADLQFVDHDASPDTSPSRDGSPGDALAPGLAIARRTFATQRPLLDVTATSSAAGNPAALAAPITAGDHRLGVLVAYAPRAPIFADSDLELVRLLADQAAIILESRSLLEEAARVRARAEADRLKDEFLASISHDLRNPLAAARGVAQVLTRRLDRAGEVEPVRLGAGLANIIAATGQMEALIDQLLDFARLQMGRPLSLDRRETDLIALTRQVATIHAGASERHRLRLDVPDAPMIGWWDTGRLERVLHNLLGNALKYSPGGGEVVVRICQERDEISGTHWAVLTVQDEGLGIPAADLPLVFQRFHRGTNVAGSIAGTGIGLASSRQVVEEHGGQITAASDEGRGSTFTVRMPLSAPGVDGRGQPDGLAVGDRRRDGAPAGPASYPMPPGDVAERGRSS